MTTHHTHPKDCPDQKAAALDRKQHESVRMETQRRQQVLAHAEWFEWYPRVTHEPLVARARA